MSFTVWESATTFVLLKLQRRKCNKLQKLTCMHATFSYASIIIPYFWSISKSWFYSKNDINWDCDGNKRYLNTFSVMLAYIHVKHIGMVWRKKAIMEWVMCFDNFTVMFLKTFRCATTYTIEESWNSHWAFNWYFQTFIGF